MSSLLVKNALAIVTVDDEDRILKNESILIEDGVITYIGKEARQADREIRADGCFVYPGLINTHNHLYQTFTRNLPQVQKMELFPWLITLYEIWKGLDEDCIFYSSLTGLGELLRNGCTTAMDHHYVFPRVGSEHFIDRQFEAADLLGIRFHATRGSMSLGKSDGGLPPDELVQPVDVILKDSRRLVEKYHDPKPFAMHQVSLAPCSPFSVSEDLLVESAALARSLGVRLHTHLCETKDEEHFTLSKVGMRPLAYMEKCGWVGPDVWYAHGIHFNDDELRLLADTGTGIAHCPVSNMKLSSGINMKYFGKTSGTVAALLAVVVVTGSLSSLIMFQARGEMKAAQEGYWWRSWGKIHPKYDSPVVSMLWQSGFALILVFMTTIQDLLGIFTFICLVRNALLFVAWFPLQKKENYKPSFRAPGGAIMAILAIVPSAILAWGELGGIVSGEVPLLSWNPISAGLLVIASALPFYFYFRKVNADIIEEAERRRNEAILGTSD